MPNFFDHISSPLSCFQLTHSAPSAKTEAQLEPLAEQLQGVGCNRLQDVLKRSDGRTHVLRSDDLCGNPNIHEEHLRRAITSFFLTSEDTQTRSYRHHQVSGTGGCDVHVQRIGSVKTLPHGAEANLFWAESGVRADVDTAALAAMHWGCNSEEVVNAYIPAIPAAAGLTPLNAMSLTAPVKQPPREVIFDGTAGAIFSYTPHTFAIQAELSWSPQAFVGSLNALQEIGRWLIISKAIERAVERGSGDLKVPVSSALLSKAYEAAAQVGRSQEQPFVVSGIWGVAVLPIPREDNTCFIQIGVIGNVINQEETVVSTQPELNIERTMAVIRLRVSRNDFGFVSMAPDLINTFAPRHIEWHSSLPVICGVNVRE